jgi:hypothetical protein
VLTATPHQGRNISVFCEHNSWEAVCREILKSDPSIALLSRGSEERSDCPLDAVEIIARDERSAAIDRSATDVRILSALELQRAFAKVARGRHRAAARRVLKSAGTLFVLFDNREVDLGFDALLWLVDEMDDRCEVSVLRDRASSDGGGLGVSLRCAVVVSALPSEACFRGNFN